MHRLAGLSLSESNQTDETIVPKGTPLCTEGLNVGVVCGLSRGRLPTHSRKARRMNRAPSIRVFVA
jgi:hypothetical protein